MTNTAAVEANLVPDPQENSSVLIIHFAGEILDQVPPGYILYDRKDGTFGLIPMPGPYTGYFDGR